MGKRPVSAIDESKERQMHKPGLFRADHPQLITDIVRSFDKSFTSASATNAMNVPMPGEPMPIRPSSSTSSLQHLAAGIGAPGGGGGGSGNGSGSGGH